MVALSLAAVACMIAAAQAQRHKPHKLRATALAELTTDRKGTVTAHLIPITILDQGLFRDASMYKATPVPMALDDGIVYEAQKSGEIAGYVTIIGRATKDKDGAWSALGRWRLPSAPRPAATPAPTTTDERPRLHRSDSSNTASIGANTPPAASPSPGPSPSPAASPSPTATPAAHEPVPEDPNRPILRRGRPEPPPASSTAPAPAAPSSATPSSASSVAAAPKLSAAPGTQFLVAVSDTESTDTRSFAFAWKKGEQQAMEAKLRRLAVAQLPKENPPLTERSLTHVAIRSLDLDLTNEAVMVLTAEIPGNVAQATKGAPAKAPLRYMTLIARVDMETTPQKLAVSITDASRLDVTPRIELIDAVDVDGDGVAELLFRQYSFDSTSYVIFSVGRTTVTKVFEGASTPLR